MAYSALLGGSQQLAIANIGQQTQVSLTANSPGQQQSQSTSFSTGQWSGKPKLFQTATGFILQIESDRGSHYVSIQQNSISNIQSPGDLSPYPEVDLKAGADPNTESSSPMPPMQPMQPMQPMKMGNMSMDANSMSMRMGNMSMDSNNPKKNSTTKQFCSQCGVEAKTGDRFCRSCGHELNT